MADSQTSTRLRELAKEVEQAARDKYMELNSFDVPSDTGDSELNAPGRDEVDSAVSGIVARFEKMLLPDPETIGRLADPFRAVAEQLGTAPGEHGNPDLGGIEDAKTRMSEWDGRLRDNFVDHYLTDFPTVIGNQGALAGFLADSATTLSDIHQDRRSDAVNIATETINALEAITMAGGAMFGVELVASRAVPTFLPALAGLADGESAGSGGGEPGVGYVAEPRTEVLGADTPEGVLDNMRRALDAVDERATENENRVRAELSGAMELTERHISENLSRATGLLPAQPDLVGASDGEVTAGLMPHG